MKENLIGFFDSDFVGELNDRKSTSEFVFLMGSGVVLWSAKKQQIVILSSTKAEFIVVATCSCQAIWLRRLLEVLQSRQQGSTIIFFDNISAIKISKSPILHGKKSKHIDMRFHFLHDFCNNGTIELKFCRSQDQMANIMTKPLKQVVFVKLRRILGYALQWKLFKS